jgi:hypothetical protein
MNKKTKKTPLSRSVAQHPSAGSKSTRVPAPESSQLSPFRVGNCVLIRTVTHFQVGEIVEIGPQEILLRGASWVADTGKLHQALKSGVLSEIEPFSDGIVLTGRGAIVDVCNWRHPLPTEEK